MKRQRPKTDESQLGSFAMPANVGAEQSVLGAILIAGWALEVAASKLSPKDFTREIHQHIFEASLELAYEGIPVDMITLKNHLIASDRFEAIGDPYLTSLFDTVPTPANVEYYADIVLDRSWRRQLILAAIDTKNRATDLESPVHDVLNESQAALLAVGSKRKGAALVEAKDDLKDMDNELESLADGTSKKPGLSTPFGQWDYMTSGLQPQDFIIVAARPSVGKTSFALAVAEYAATHEKKSVAIFSIEMPRKQLLARMICSQAEINSRNLKTGRLDPDEWDRYGVFASKLYESRLSICDATDITTAAIRAECRRRRFEKGLDLIVVDYLQLVRANRPTDNMVQDIGTISRELKAIAREFDVPLIALSQLSRAVERRDNKRPMLSDLRESGSIEAEADMVCFLYREAYYKQKDAFETPGTPQGDEPIREDITELIIAKHRNGPTGFVNIGFIPQYTKFRPWQEPGNGLDMTIPTGF